ncbi:MAG TPA: tetratricopeptide repeat protein [Prolixibacteraceae bacterium]
MLRNKNIFIAVILLIAFAGITIVKYWGHTGNSGSLTEVVKSGTQQTFWTHYNRATEYRLQGKADSSIMAYQEALKMNQHHEDALYYIGNMYRKADKFDQAQKAWEKLIELNPQSERAYNQLGNLYFCVRHPDYFHPAKSKSYFKRAANLNKETLNPNLRLGEIALFQNSIHDASGIFNKLSMMDQKNAEIFFILGYLNWKSGKEPDAIRNLEHTFELGIAAVLTNEQGEAAGSAKNASIGKKQECNLFMDWLTGNLMVPEKYAVKVEMPKVYRKFDQYLIMVRDQLNHD